LKNIFLIFFPLPQKMLRGDTLKRRHGDTNTEKQTMLL